MGIDIWEVVETAKTKPFGYMPFYPGPGLGGHCIPIDPFYLSWKAKQHSLQARFIELAGKVNTAMPEYVGDRVMEALNDRGKLVNDSRVLIVGIAYKPDVDDDRESPGYHLMDLLKDQGAEVAYHDPHVPVIQPSREHSHWAGTKSIEWKKSVIEAFDVVVIATKHSAISFGQLNDWASCIVDTRNAMAGTSADGAKILKA